MSKERLEYLANLLDQTPADKFAMGEWRCGAAACAVGTACSDPWFNARGLRFVIEWEGDEPTPAYAGLSSWEAVRQFFDLGVTASMFLFDADAYIPAHVYTYSKDGRVYYDTGREFIITPQEVAARIRNYVEFIYA